MKPVLFADGLETQKKSKTYPPETQSSESRLKLYSRPFQIFIVGIFSLASKVNLEKESQHYELSVRRRKLQSVYGRPRDPFPIRTDAKVRLSSDVRVLSCIGNFQTMAANLFFDSTKPER
ncbi:hypothetical protein CDAR_562201 [Caerostris darwini]|uniref:Uncharacterized protein n=1 Tax=Caerostris darwini TaxID=1538125 RepID=A0AAV4PGP0_9ARAC|nr:hypothetical protein CDAR_562201 [Caerostris darwini]